VSLSEPWRILLVDDDVRMHELAGWAFRTPQFNVHAFADPRQALANIGDIKPHLIICDMMMPTMDGQDFLRLVKQAPALKRIPFLFLTAVRLGSEVQAALDGGADAYLVKPFPLAQLVETVKRILAAGPATTLEEADGSRLSTGLESERPAAMEGQAWPETNLADALGIDTGSEESALAAEAPTPSPTTRIVVPEVPWVPMESKGATVLSGTTLSVPERNAEDVEEAAEGEDGAGSGLDVQPPVFEGRFSTVQHGGRRLQVVTEAASHPNFVITTVVSADGRGLRKLESFWSHPLRRAGDLELVKRQIDLQHDRVVADARSEPLFGPRRRRVWRSRKRTRSKA
jgi:CheY-like chemotaxis protein